MSGVVTVPELLDGHTVLDIECLDRLYLNGYVPKLQVGGQVVTFLRDHLGMPVVSPGSPSCPTGSPAVMTPTACSGSATGSGRATSRHSSIGGRHASRCR